MVGRRLSAARVAWVDVDVWLVDLLLADLLGDLLLLGAGLGAQADPLDRDGFLGHHRALGVQGDFVFFLADGEAGQRDVPVGLGELSGRRSSSGRHPMPVPVADGPWLLPHALGGWPVSSRQWLTH